MFSRGFGEPRNGRLAPAPEQSHDLQSLDGDEAETMPLLPRQPPLQSGRSYLDVPPFGWRPFYLRRCIQTVFSVVFVLFAIIISLMAKRSREGNGILAANKSMYYLWIFGPTLFVALLLSFWSRVELQSIRYSPWMRLGRGGTDSCDAARTILIDYYQLFPLNAVVMAVINRDFLVATAMTISLIIYVQLFFSTSLIVLEARLFESHVDISVRDSFTQQASDNGGLAQRVPFVVMNGMLALNLSIPTAYAPGFAFQDFALATSEPTHNFQHLTAEVDAVWVEMQCKPPALIKEGYGDGYGLSFVGTPCRSRRYDIGLQQRNSARILPQGMSYFWIYDDVTACLPANGTVILAAVVAVHRSGDELLYVNSSQVMCEANLALGRASVTYNTGQQTALVLREPSNWTVLDTHVGKEMEKYRSDSRGLGRDFWENTDADYSGQLMLNPFRVGIGLGWASAPNISKVLNDSIVEDIIMLWTKRFGSLLAHFHHRKIEPSISAGTAIMQKDRLVIEQTVQRTMASLFSLMAFLSLVMIWQSPKQGFIPRDPDTISGSVALLSESRELLDKLHATGSKDMAEIERRLNGTYRTVFRQFLDDPRKPSFFLREDGSGDNLVSSGGSFDESDKMRFVPWSLLLWIRALACFIMIALVVLFLYLLNIRAYDKGFYDADGSSYGLYLWTLPPKLMLTGLTLYLRACDFSIRFLAPFHVLKHRQTFFKSLAVSYTDLIGVRILSRSFQNRNWSVFFSKLLSTTCALLPILANDLFSVKSRDRPTQIHLQQQTWFASENFTSFSWQAPNVVGDLLLMNDDGLHISFPPWTYEEFAFHAQSIVREKQNSPPRANASISGIVPAVKVDLDCTLATIKGPLSTGVEFDLLGRHFYCFDGLDCRRHKYFGGGIGGGVWESVCNVPNPVMSVTNYVWGGCDGNAIDYLAVLSFSEKAVEADLKATFHGTELQLDTTMKPPVPLEDSYRPYPFHGHTEGLYAMLEPYEPRIFFDVSPGGYLGRFFKSLVSSRFAVPMAYLGSNKTSEQVIAAIKKHHGIIRAQTLTFATNDSIAKTPPIRQPFIDKDSVSSPSSPAKERPNPTTATLHTAQNRLTLREGTTKVVLYILSIVVILEIVSIYLTPRDPLYKSPGSIAAMASLVANSTIFKHLPEGAEWMADEVLGRHFEGKSFRMGKFHIYGRDRVGDRGSGMVEDPVLVFTIGIVEDEEAAIKDAQLEHNDSLGV